MGRRYWLLLSAFLASSLGTWIYRLALPLLVYDLTGSRSAPDSCTPWNTCRTSCSACSAGCSRTGSTGGACS
ncbi:hypothetical protein [Nonomuraea diastatica]|uniref:Uncharacterized protein n=1 Tax=Nonomuraea diastatica TaxID=1848329 RepID=A0A4R4X7U5_9ACTN|nr:hypothetical protein [Nonomuraea diastatica]TDD26455.1 hypothetical protein E1294_00390 [Nonomuraea diastatica]